MPTLPPGLSKSYQLQPGETLSITTDANSICRYGQLTPGTSAVGAKTAAEIADAFVDAVRCRRAEIDGEGEMPRVLY